ncbi:MAG: hypothetical protein C0154_15105 [Mucilaginibacter sp.]|nr:MAG: hypothetical protein C0154_15105 [Mucilaginibacter sp.]PMP65679.1 MAG: hypothetical protein C0191_02925 [Mucilaginibacter sp.]
MPFIAAVSKIQFPFKVDRADVKAQARSLLLRISTGGQTDPHLDITEIVTRNFCKLITYYAEPNAFVQNYNDYISIHWSIT